MKKITLILVGFSMFFFQSVKSEELYIGLDYLSNTIDSGVTNISSTLDEKDTGYSLFAGLPINESFDFEFSYNDFGKTSLSGVSGNRFIVDGVTYQFNATGTLSAAATSFGLAAKPKIEIAESAMLYGKLGIHRWDSEFSISSTTASADASETGTDVFFGGGIEVKFSGLQARVGYTQYTLDSDDIKSINAGLSYSF